MPSVLEDVVSRLTALERDRDRRSAARVLSAPISNADVAAGAGIAQSKLATLVIGNSNVAVGALHPNRLSAWSGGTFANHVLYDTGSGVSVAKVGDSFVNVAGLSVNRIHGGSSIRRVPTTNDGTNTVWDWITTQMIYANNVASSVVSAAHTATLTAYTGGYQVHPGSTASITTSPYTNFLMISVWSRFRTLNAGAYHQLFVGWNGSPVIEVGTVQQHTAGYYNSISGTYLVNVGPNTLYNVQAFFVGNAGNVGIDSGYTFVAEIKR